MKKNLLLALRARYQAESLAAKANLEIYLNKSVGIGEHPDVVGECDKLVSVIADSEEKLALVSTLLKDLVESGE